MTPQTRRTIAILCIGLVLIAGVVPVLSAALGAVLFVPLWLVLPAAIAVLVRREASESAEQPLGLLVLAPSRAPPAARA